MRVGVGGGMEGYCASCSLCRDIEIPEDDFQEKPEDDSVITLDRCVWRGGKGREGGWGVGSACMHVVVMH